MLSAWAQEHQPFHSRHGCRAARHWADQPKLILLGARICGFQLLCPLTDIRSTDRVLRRLNLADSVTARGAKQKIDLIRAELRLKHTLRPVAVVQGVKNRDYGLNQVTSSTGLSAHKASSHRVKAVSGLRRVVAPDVRVKQVTSIIFWPS